MTNINEYTYLPELYSLSSKGKTQVWSVKVRDNVVFTTHGVLGGQLQHDSKFMDGKNIGRANETSPAQQALLEAKRLWKSKVDKGYVDSVEELATPFLPMLAKDFNEHQDKVKYPCVVQPKLDGIRCMAYWVGDELVLMSRAGKPLDVPHVQAELAAKLPRDVVLDGEFYIHGKNFQEITRLVKKVRPESIELEYHVYDGFRAGQEDTSFHNRQSMLSLVFVSKYENVVWVENRHATSLAEVSTIHSQMVADGYEGAIIRNYAGAYKLKHRSTDLLKLKSFMDAEYKVVGYEVGSGRFKGVPIWVCETPEGNTFSVVCKGTMEEKATDLENANELVGKWLKVKFFELSEDRIPRFPVGLGFRMEEDMS